VLGEAVGYADRVELEEQDLEPVFARGRDTELPFVFELREVVVAESERRGRPVEPVLEHVRAPAHGAVANAPASGANVELGAEREAQQRAPFACARVESRPKHTADQRRFAGRVVECDAPAQADGREPRRLLGAGMLLAVAELRARA
jgi:hypothetical protein